MIVRATIKVDDLNLLMDFLSSKYWFDPQTSKLIGTWFARIHETYMQVEITTENPFEGLDRNLSNLAMELAIDTYQGFKECPT
jgi:hypothetical protein